MTSSLDVCVQYLKGIGPKRAKTLSKIGIKTVEDILYYFPRRYEDRANFSTIASLKAGQTQTVKGRVLARGERRSFHRRGFSITEAAVGDDTGKIFCVWFNQPYMKEYLEIGTTVILYGKIDYYGARLQMNSPEFEIVPEGAGKSLNVGRITPVYSLPQGLTQRYFRKIIKNTLDEYLPKFGDFLPYSIRTKNNLLNLAASLINIHFPENFELQKDAFKRLSFDEFFLLQVTLVLRKLKKKEKKGIAHKTEGELVRHFVEALPFKLTDAQNACLGEIKSDMAGRLQMQRLLQGDVGSGKTVVAFISAVMAIQGGYQAAFMAPTEILAKQHYKNISSLLNVHGSLLKEIKIGLLTGSAADKEKKKICKEIKEGKINLIIGTHALLEESVGFKNLGLVVIDEQHKFGVGQRLLLPGKGGNPDVLIMTATPIPRTLAITLYGDLDVSVISELPSGRLPVKTMHFQEKESFKAYEALKTELRLGHQAYIVYPVIEESYALDMAGAKKMYSKLKTAELKEFRLGLIHGKLKQDEQDGIMLKFKNRELDVLVSTTVLEVGIDVANATCMIIENAQRFGLSQLHQLRGRVGRGAFGSFCILISEAGTEEAKARIAAMLKYADGFRIAEEDLRIRGPGEFFGDRQHGLCELKIANPLTQIRSLKRAREEAVRLVNADPSLSERQNYLLKERISKRFPQHSEYNISG